MVLDSSVIELWNLCPPMGQSGKSPSIPLNKAVYVIPFPMVIPFYIQLQFNYIPVDLPDCPIVNCVDYVPCCQMKMVSSGDR